jgi:hypothetical protein
MKLVRDRIPELAAANGHPGTSHQADPAEYARRLRDKLLEEPTRPPPPARPAWPRSWATSSRSSTPSPPTRA